jgi:hypothetical protein
LEFIMGLVQEFRIGLFLAIVLCASMGAAQERLRVGQNVEVNVRGRWVEGEVTRVMPDGQSVQVRIKQGGRPQVGVVALGQVRLPSKPGASDSTLGGAEPAFPGGQLRMWSDATGQFKIEAVLVAKQGANIKLRKTDGVEISVPISKLSRADVEFLATAPDPQNQTTGSASFQAGQKVEVLQSRRWWPATVVRTEGQRWLIHYDDYSDAFDEWVESDRIRKPGDPAPSGTPGMASVPGSSQTPAADLGVLQVETVACSIDSSTVKALEKLAPPEGLAPDPAKLSTLATGATPLRDLSTFESLASIAPISETTIIASIVNQPPGKSPSTQLAWCNVAEKRVTKDAALPGGNAFFACDATNGWLLTYEPRDNKRLVVWKWPKVEESPQPVYALVLQNDDPNPFSKTFEDAHLAGAGRALFLTGGDEVVLWDLEKRRVEKLWKAEAAAVSPGGRYLAMYGENGIAIVDLSTGQQAGFWDTGWLPLHHMEFSPDGAQLAFTYNDRDLRVYDLNTGESKYQGVLPPGSVVGDNGLLWTNDSHILVGQKYLVDLEAGCVIWDYTLRSIGSTFILQSFAGHVAYIARDILPGSSRIPTLCVVTLPHPEATQALNNVDKTQLFGLAPGREVSLQINIGGADGDRVRSSLEKQIAANGWKVNSAAPAKLIASITRGAPKSQSYQQGAGFNGPTTTVTYQPLIHRVVIQIDGAESWLRQTETGPSGVLVAREGQSLQQAAAETEKPYPEFFDNLGIPRQIVRPQFLGGFGKSQLSVQGIVSN